MPDERVHPSYQSVTSHVRDLADTLHALVNEPDPLLQVAIIARELQPAVGYLLRDLVGDTVDGGRTWGQVGDAMGMDGSSVFAQHTYGNGSPMVSYQAKAKYVAPNRQRKMAREHPGQGT